MSENRPSVTRLTARGAAAVLLGLLAAACGTTGPTDGLDRERERLEQARGQWRSQNIVDYQYTFRRNCFCGPDTREPAVVTVRAGSIVSVESVATGAPKDPAFYFTIEGLFDLLEEAIDQEAARVSASYHPGLGYPTTAFIDRSEMIADEELGFDATDMQPQR